MNNEGRNIDGLHGLFPREEPHVGSPGQPFLCYDMLRLGSDNSSGFWW